MKLLVLLFLVSLNLYAETPLVYQAQDKGIELSEKDKEILEVGKISDTRYIVGGVLGTYPIGFGVGHAIQGRWTQDGWIFTAGEAATISIALVGMLGCATGSWADDDNECTSGQSALIAVGLIGFVGFRIWEIVDVWAVPPSHNRKFRDLKKMIQDKPPKPEVKASLDLHPFHHAKLGQGAALTFRF